MQIVIDLPEEIIKDAKESPNYYPSYLFGTIWKSIGNGTVVNDDEWMKKADKVAKLHKRDALDDVKNKIIKRFEGCYLDGTLDEWAQGEHYAYMKVLEIIDKHLRGNINER